LSVKIGNISEGSCLNNRTQNDTPDNACSLNTVIDCTRYSSLKKLIVTTAYVMRFINNLRKRVKKQSNVITDVYLKVDEYETALSMWIKDEQLVIKRQSNFRNLRASLNLFEDKDGSIRPTVKRTICEFLIEI
jgi:aminopeptidase N